MGWTTLISNFFSAVAGVFGFAGKRSDANNTDAMKQAKEAKGESAAVDQTNQTIAKRDENQIRKDLSE